MAERRYRDSAVSRAIEQLGGLKRAAQRMRLTYQALAYWRRLGYVARRDMAERMARLTGIPSADLLALTQPAERSASERMHGAA